MSLTGLQTFMRRKNVFIPFKFKYLSRYCSNQAALQSQTNILEKNNIMELIHNYETRDFDRMAHKTNYNIQKFALHRKNDLEKIIQEDKELYHPVLFSIICANNGSEIVNILNNINVNDFSHDESTAEHIGYDKEKCLNPSIHRIYCKAIRCCADLQELDVCWQIFETCKQLKIISNELYNTMMWVTMYNDRSRESLHKVFVLFDELKTNNLFVHPRTYSTLINSCINIMIIYDG